MRILFTFVGGQGHFEPLVPLARAAQAAGHTVAFGCAPSMQPMVEAAGFAASALGTHRPAAPQRLPLQPLDVAREERDLRERFVRRAARYRIPHAIRLSTEWRADLVVCDETDFGVALAAERLGLPWATVQISAVGSFVRAQVVGEALAELRAEQGLPADPACEMLQRYLVLSPFPPGLRDPAHPPPRTLHAIRPPRALPRAEPAPTWSRVIPGAPVVYFTLGTVFNLESGDLFARVLAGLREASLNLLVTVGREIDPIELGPQPASVRIERIVQQAEVLPYCDLVVSHGGSGSLVGALAHGLPSVLIPMGADQPLNATRGAELGVAKVLDALAVDPEGVREAVAEVLRDARYRRNAERLRSEIDALPDVSEACALLERLARERKPLVGV